MVAERAEAEATEAPDRATERNAPTDLPERDVKDLRDQKVVRLKKAVRDASAEKVVSQEKVVNALHTVAATDAEVKDVEATEKVASREKVASVEHTVVVRDALATTPKVVSVEHTVVARDVEATTVARDVEGTENLSSREKEVNVESSVDPEVVTEVAAVASEVVLISSLLLKVVLRLEPHTVASKVLRDVEDSEVAVVPLTPESTESQESPEKVVTTDQFASSTATLPREVESTEVLPAVVPDHLPEVLPLSSREQLNNDHIR